MQVAHLVLQKMHHETWRGSSSACRSMMTITVRTAAVVSKNFFIILVLVVGLSIVLIKI